MLEEIKKHKDHPWLQEVRDVRVLGLVVFGVIVLLVSWSGVRVIETNYRLQRQIAQLEQRNSVQRLQNANEKLANQYYQSDEYLELQARRQFAKAAPGETLVIVPERVAMAHSTNLPAPKQRTIKQVEAERPFYQKNIEAWMSFFLHRDT